MRPYFPIPRYEIDLDDKDVRNSFIVKGGLNYYSWLYSVKNSMIIVNNGSKVIQVINGMNFLKIQRKPENATEVFIEFLLNNGLTIFGDIVKRVILFSLRPFFDFEKELESANCWEMVEVVLSVSETMESSTFSLFRDGTFSIPNLSLPGNITGRIQVTANSSDIIITDDYVRKLKIWSNLINWVDYLLRQNYYRKMERQIKKEQQKKAVLWEKEAKENYPQTYEQLCRKIKYKFN